MTAYNTADFDPPAPLAYVTLKHTTTDAAWTNVPMQMDTGADVTLIPEAAVRQLGLTILSDVRYELTGFDNSVTEAFAVELKLIFCRRTFRGKFLLTNQSVGMLGRDILNLVPLLFNGPSLEWLEHRVQ